jgi:hypothetical protein
MTTLAHLYQPTNEPSNSLLLNQWKVFCLVKKFVFRITRLTQALLCSIVDSSPRTTCYQSQIEEIDYGETLALVARLEYIHILLAYALHQNFILQQIDVKSAILNDPLRELVYLNQLPGFEDPQFPNHVYKLDKTLYGLKEAPRAWYEHLRELLVNRGFEIGVIDPTLITKRVNGDF